MASESPDDTQILTNVLSLVHAVLGTQLGGYVAFQRMSFDNFHKCFDLYPPDFSN